uniref:Ionotropic glutamate receptor C-terminal domain-containing protein n=1 Tax=Timema poppense TaxID=170557 RepID=A0A7R9H8B3_TIMPO|nr:unnamed protein product [Timema poppensis]
MDRIAQNFYNTGDIAKERIFVRASNDAKYSEWGNFVAPFSPSLWLTLGVFIVGISAYFHVLHAIRMHMCDSETRVPRRYCPYKSVFHVLGAFCQQGQGITPRSSSCRIALLFTLLTAVLTLSTYSGSFISNLSIPLTKFPYDNLEQMLNQGNYTFAVLRQSAEYDQFEVSIGLIKETLENKTIEETYRIHLSMGPAWNNGSSPPDEPSLSRANKTLKAREVWKSKRRLGLAGHAQ